MEYYPDFPEEEEEQAGSLVRLSRVKYELAEDQPDAMGWRTADVDGIEFGTVTDLLADAITGQIIFAAIRNDATGKTALIPVEGMFLDMTKCILIIPVQQSEIMGCPDFTEDVIDLMPYVEYWVRLAAV